MDHSSLLCPDSYRGCLRSRPRSVILVIKIESLYLLKHSPVRINCNWIRKMIIAIVMTDMYSVGFLNAQVSDPS